MLDRSHVTNRAYPLHGKAREARLRRLREAGRTMFAKDAAAALAVSAKLREPARTVAPNPENQATPPNSPE